jgi:hypothetical protein
LGGVARFGAREGERRRTEGDARDRERIHPRLYVDRACGEPVLLQDARFVVLLRAVVAHERSAGSWSDRYDLGIGDDRGMVTHLRNELKEVVPEGFQVIEAGGGKQYRLNPEIVVEETNGEKLMEHPNAAVRKIAVEMVKRKGRGVELKG